VIHGDEAAKLPCEIANRDRTHRYRPRARARRAAASCALA
jgi:hypothetical protein